MPTPKTPRAPRKPKNAFALPVRAADAAPVPAFTPVPRQYYRHDGWTPERQVAFIGALADTGCVDRAARMVNMAQTNCYTLRRAPGAEEFRKAWDAALDFGLGRLKDIAFQRAVEGELVPVFAAGKLMGFRRKRNDALLMFCLRHYGKDNQGKRTTINYFSSRASAGAGVTHPSTSSGRAEVGANPSPAHAEPVEAGAGAIAEASSTTVRTVITGGDERAASDPAAALEAFEGVTLDAEAQAAIMAALEECAARARVAEEAIDKGGDEAAACLADDPGEEFVTLPKDGFRYRGTLETGVEIGEVEGFHEGEDDWRAFGTEKPDWSHIAALPSPPDEEP